MLMLNDHLEGSDSTGLDAGSLALIKGKYLHYRYLSMKDAYRAQRDDWVENAFPGMATYSFADEDTNHLSRSRENYDGLIVGGNDVTRMARFLKANRSAVAGVVKICLMHGANAQKRAQALMAGFDDVFDVEKMRVEEAVARLDSIERRYRAAAEANNEQARIDRLLRDIAEVDRLTDRERLILETFLKTGNRQLAYFKIQSLCSTFHAEVSFENVKVIVCNLRKKLRDGVRIEAKAGEGYRLIIGDEAKV